MYSQNKTHLYVGALLYIILQNDKIPPKKYIFIYITLHCDYFIPIRKWKPGLLQSMGSQRVGHDLVTEQHSHGTQAKLINKNVIHFQFPYL